MGNKVAAAGPADKNVAIRKDNPKIERHIK